MDWKAAFMVFLGMMLADVMWAIYFVCVARKHKNIASLASGLIVWIGSTVTINYVHDPRLMLWAVAGAVFGTYMTIQLNEWWDKYNASKRSRLDEAKSGRISGNGHEAGA